MGADLTVLPPSLLHLEEYHKNDDDDDDDVFNLTT